MKRYFLFLGLFFFLSDCSKQDDKIINEEYNKSKTSNNGFSFYKGQNTYTINHFGLLREYVLYIPPNIETRKNLPVIFNFHGYQGKANEHFNNTNLKNIADENGVVLVYPQGAPLDGGPSHWNAAPLNSSSESFINKSNVNDLDFFLSLLNIINQNNMLNLDRVYAIGYSNGGMFSHFLACNTENVFAAIGDVAGTMLTDAYNNCNPSSPIPVLKIHGTNDGVVPYNANVFIYNDLYDQFKSVDQVVNFWKINNKSNDQFSFNNFVSSSWENYMGPVNFEKYTYESDENQSEVVLYKMLGGGHWWDYSLDENLKTSSLLWDFFSKHSRQ